MKVTFCLFVLLLAGCAKSEQPKWIEPPIKTVQEEYDSWISVLTKLEAEHPNEGIISAKELLRIIGRFKQAHEKECKGKK